MMRGSPRQGPRGGKGPRSAAFHSGGFYGAGNPFQLPHSDLETVLSFEGSDGATYTVSRHSNKTAESTVEATKKDADEEGDDNQGPLSPDAVSRPDEDDIAPASESDFPEVSHEGMRAEVRPGKDDQKSLLADGIEAALKSDKIKRVEEVWSEYESSWVPKQAKPEDPNRGRLLFIFRLRWQTEDTPEPYICVELFDDSLVEILRQNLVGYEDLLDDNAKILGRDLYLLADDLTALLTETRLRADDLEAGKIKLQDLLKPVDLLSDAEITNEVKQTPPTPASLRHSADALELLLACNAREHALTTTKLQRIPAGQTTFKLLWTLFKPRIDIAFDHPLSERKMAAQLVWSGYTVSQDGAEEFRIDAMAREWIGETFEPRSESIIICAFRGFKPISELPGFPLTPELKVQLTKRGKLYQQYTGVHHLQYNGTVTRIIQGPLGNSTNKIRVNGRVVVDTAAYRRFNPNSPEFAMVAMSHPAGGHRAGRGRRNLGLFDQPPPPAAYDIYGDPIPAASRKESAVIKELDEDSLHYCPPVMYGLALATKEWGAITIEDLRPIEWREGAFEHLSINEDDKSIIKALVTASTMQSDDSKTRLTDVIEGKGGGIAILLHGRPGTGKTLTAESTAELLKRPLYPLTAGDLSESAHQLEESLRDIFETSANWQAITLLDEADVFLEARSRHEIHRNSLISVFLRMLECVAPSLALALLKAPFRYHSGIMFLTTNRIRVFDPAVFSRFSISIRFPDLEDDRRRIVFEKFLHTCGVKVGDDEESTVQPSDVVRFAREPLNGRVIKRLLQTAQSLALVEQRPLSTEYIDRCLKLHKRFIADFDAVDEEGRYFEDAQQSRALYA